MNIIAAHDMVCRLVRSALSAPAATALIESEDDWLWSEAAEIEMASLIGSEEDGTRDVMEEVAEAARAFARKVVNRNPDDTRPGFSHATCDSDSQIEVRRCRP